jgi:hypothetical protein
VTFEGARRLGATLRRTRLGAAALVLQARVSTADTIALRSGGGLTRRSSSGAVNEGLTTPAAADEGLTTPAAAGAFRRCSSRSRGVTSSDGHFSPRRLGATALGDAAWVADDALSDLRCYAAWFETKAATAGSLARPATALADDPANTAREAARQLNWCVKQASVAARASLGRVCSPGANRGRDLARGSGAGFPRCGTCKELARHDAAGPWQLVPASRAQLAVAVAAGGRIRARV